MLSPEAKKKANKVAQTKFRAKNQGITQKPIIEQKNNIQDALCPTSDSNTRIVIPRKVIPIGVKVIPIVIPIVIPSNTHKRYKVFADLSPGTQADILRINSWCKDNNIPDNLEQRIGIALDYARQHAEQNSGLSVDGKTFTDAVGKVHQWPAVLDTVNATGMPRVKVG